MYVLGYTKHDDEADLLALMQAYSFATLVTAPGGRPFATHLPIMVQRDEAGIVRTSHLARANPQWKHFGEGEALAIFQGLHALVHSAWYSSAPNVPTWNYAVVHAYGQAEIIRGEREKDIAYGLVAAHTPDMSPLPEDFERRLMAAVVTFELKVTQLEGKFKLSQNKNDQDRENVIAALSGSRREVERETAALMDKLEVRKVNQEAEQQRDVRLSLTHIP